MNKTYLCPRCGQPMPSRSRAGVCLPAKKADIFDTIDKHPGITAEGILANCFDDAAGINLVRQHIYQINCMLAGTRTRISGNEPFTRGEYRIVREAEK
jgi:hypothetical protein